MKSNKSIAVCVHGLFGFRHQLNPIRRSLLLSQRYANVEIFEYQPTVLSTDDCASKFLEELNSTLQRHQDVTSVHLVSHSLGAIVTRAALSRIHETKGLDWVSKLKIKWVQITPANRGSEYARLLQSNKLLKSVLYSVALWRTSKQAKQVEEFLAKTIASAAPPTGKEEAVKAAQQQEDAQQQELDFERITQLFKHSHEFAKGSSFRDLTDRPKEYFDTKWQLREANLPNLEIYQIYSTLSKYIMNPFISIPNDGTLSHEDMKLVPLACDPALVKRIEHIMGQHSVVLHKPSVIQKVRDLLLPEAAALLHQEENHQGG